MNFRGMLEKVFTPAAINQSKVIKNYFKMLNAYTPHFSTYDGGVYEMDLTRAAIHCIANQCAKLKPEIIGSAYKNLEKTLQFKPNKYMDTYKFIYKLATILFSQNTAFIVPVYASDLKTITGLYPLPPTNAEIVEYNGTEFLKYKFLNGQTAAIELDRVGIMSQHLYKSDFFGESNNALNPTMQLLYTQNQGIIEGVKQSASIRFMAQLASVLKPELIEQEKRRFTEDNLSSSNNSGVMMFDGKYKDIKQINSTPYVIDDKQMNSIKSNVFNYFGVSENMLQNKWTEDEWNAFYEGKIEPFAIQLSLVITNMLFNSHERSFGNEVIFSANRLQYASNNTKLNVSSQLFDRGILNTNQIMDIWNLPHVDDGEKRYIRKEYAEINKLDEDIKVNEVEDEEDAK